MSFTAFACISDCMPLGSSHHDVNRYSCTFGVFGRTFVEAFTFFCIFPVALHWFHIFGTAYGTFIIIGSGYCSEGEAAASEGSTAHLLQAAGRQASGVGDRGRS